MTGFWHRLVARRSLFNVGLVTWVVIVCLMPTLLNLVGMDFSAPGLKEGHVDAEYRGLLLHTILVWTATCTAFFTFVLSFFHYYLKRDIVAPVIGISLLWGGFMDVFQTLAADRLIQASADNAQMIPFTWAIGRSFSIVILLIGIMVLMVRGYRGRARGSNARFFLLLSIAFGLLAFAVIQYTASSDRLPETYFPDALVSRPWDIYPLAIYALAGAWVFRRFYSERRDHFSFSVWISIMPDFVTQLHMAFGSTQLFDNHYNLAHFFKATSYLVPAVGMLKDFVDTHRNLETEIGRHLRTDESRRELLSLVNRSAELIFLVDTRTSRFRYLNQSAVRSLGLEDILDHSALELSQFLAGSDPQQAAKSMLWNLREDTVSRGERELVSLDGSRLIPVEYSAFLVSGSKDVAGMILQDVTGRLRIREERERHQAELRQLVNQRTSELAEANFRLKHELKERKALENQLLQAQKMEAMGQLAAGIAHEVNNPVGYVIMNLESLEKYVQAFRELLEAHDAAREATDEDRSMLEQRLSGLKERFRWDFVRTDVESLLGECRDGLRRVRDIVANLRTFSRRDAESDPVDLDLCEVLESSARMVHNQIKQHHLDMQLADLPSLHGHPGMLSQVFVNLLINASQAIEGSGTITIEAVRKGAHAIVRVSDTGKGIAREHYSRIFDPFFTTKPPGTGTGLGLYVSYEIVKRHGGDLFFWSDQGKGTTFQVTLPLTGNGPTS